MIEYTPLTQQEIDVIIQRHHYLVDKMNETLGGVLKYEDEAIKARLQEPQAIALYHMNEENKRREQERETIIANLETKYGLNQVRNNPLNRTFKYCLKLGNDPKDVAYNEKIYQEYIRNPDKLVYREVNKLFQLNPQHVYVLGDDKQAQAEFYMDNTALCEFGYAFQSVVHPDEAHATKTLHDAAATMKKPYETLNEFGNMVKINGIEALACPSLTTEQCVMVMANRDLFLGNPNPELTELINNKLTALANVEDPHTFFQHFVDRGININDPEFFLKYKAVHTDPQTGAKEEVSFDRIFQAQDPNVEIETRSKEEMFQLRSINRVFQDRYAEQFQSRISNKLNNMIFDANQIEEDHKGGWFERNLLRSTSREWTEFIQAFKDFNNPEHPNYMRKDVLKPKAEAYREHKHRQGYASLADMKGTSLKRSTLVEAVIDTCDELDRQENEIKEDIDIAINTGVKGKVGLIISEKEVDLLNPDNEVENENALDKQQDLDKAFILEDDDELSM